MKLKAVTLDCAHTLVQVHWRPGAFAVECAQRLGLEFDAQVAQERYDRALYSRRQEYVDRHANGDDDLDHYWREITEEWLDAIGIAREHGDPIIALAKDRLYGPNIDQFVPYEDVGPALEWLKTQDVKLAVLSNWDYSLKRVLRALNLFDEFDLVVASLEEGVEKPDARLFAITLERLGVSASETLHVGDCPNDDYHGAKAAGLHAALLDRSSATERPRIHALTDLPEAFAWIG